jgi:DNA-binding Xre family transcriptional regulator
MYDKFLELLNSTHTTVADFCRATGLKESSLSNWKKRDKGINTDTLIVICRHFGVSSDWFLDLSNSKILIAGEAPEQPAPLPSEDQILIDAYHKADTGIQESVCKLLDIKRDSILSEEVG